MSSYAITCESTADYPAVYLRERDIQHVCFHYELDGAPHLDDLYTTTTPEAYFGALHKGSMAKTSQPSAGEYVSFWTPLLEAGKDIVHVTLSSGISGAYNSACLAREQLAPRFSERTIEVIDSLGASSGYGMLVDQMAALRDGGMERTELVAWAESAKMRVQTWFFVSDLDCLKRGGRVSATSAVIATALKICPVMDIDRSGHLIPREKIRTKRKAIEKLASKVAELAEGRTSYSGPCVLSHSLCEQDAQSVAELIGQQAPALAGHIRINEIGTVIGAHTGPGTVALFFMGDERQF